MRSNTKIFGKSYILRLRSWFHYLCFFVFFIDIRMADEEPLLNIHISIASFTY